MSGNTAFAVPKDRQIVIIHLSQGGPLEGEIFLESVAEGMSVHQKVAAFIENSSAFFPIRVSPGGTTEFINKHGVQRIEVNLPEDPGTSYFAQHLMHTIPVMVFLNDGNTVSGMLMAEVPQEKARLSDCLNLPEKYLTVKSRDKVFYVNKETLQKVVHAAKA